MIKKTGQTNPLKKSSVLGATIAALGIKGALTIHHGSQGCTAFTKTFLTQHFREIVPMQTTALTDIAAIMGEDTNLIEGIKNIIDKHSPSLVFVVTTGISETRGDDIDRTIKTFREKHPEYNGVEVYFVNTPDFEGDAHTGYVKAVISLVSKAGKIRKKDNKRINILPHFTMTAGDITEIKSLVEAFGLKPVFIPDIADSLSGKSDDFYSVAPGGTDMDDIKTIGSAMMTISIGRSMAEPASIIEKNTGVPFTQFDSLTGIAECDRFIKFLSVISKNEVPDKIKTQRKIAIDTMLDAHFFYGGKSAAIAIEPDDLLGLSKFLKYELGIDIKAGITTAKSDWFSEFDEKIMRVGDLEDLETYGSGADVVISNTNALKTSGRIGAPLLRMGIPIKDRIGTFNKSFAGYTGTAALAAELGNLLLMKEAGSF